MEEEVVNKKAEEDKKKKSQIDPNSCVVLLSFL